MLVGSPFQCMVIDPNSIAIDWESIRLCPANQPVQLDFELRAMSPSDLEIKVTGRQLNLARVVIVSNWAADDDLLMSRSSFAAQLPMITTRVPDQYVFL